MMKDFRPDQTRNDLFFFAAFFSVILNFGDEVKKLEKEVANYDELYNEYLVLHAHLWLNIIP